MMTAARYLLPLAVSATLLLPASADAACRGAAADVTAGASLHEARQAVACLLNETRAANGLGRVRPQVQLRRAAREHSEDMVARHYFAHDGPGGPTFVSRIRASGYLPLHRSWKIGENLGWGTGSLATPGAMVRAWMDSPEHRANILDPAFRDVGVGIVLGTPSAGAGATYTTDFGTRGG